MMIRGMADSFGDFLITFKSSTPFITGMNRSINMRAGVSASRRSNASRPFSARMARYPLSSITSLRVAATSRSSSTMSTEGRWTRLLPGSWPLLFGPAGVVGLEDMELTRVLRVPYRSENTRRQSSRARKADPEWRMGDPGLIRTGDLRFRKPPLYPPELRGRAVILLSWTVWRAPAGARVELYHRRAAPKSRRLPSSLVPAQTMERCDIGR